VQERLTVQIANYLKDVLATEDVAVVIDARHLCVSSRGVEDTTSSTVTATYLGKFQEIPTREEFLRHIYQKG
jgi:GTP cyclohydrolase I